MVQGTVSCIRVLLDIIISGVFDVRYTIPWCKVRFHVNIPSDIVLSGIFDVILHYGARYGFM